MLSLSLVAFSLDVAPEGRYNKGMDDTNTETPDDIYTIILRSIGSDGSAVDFKLEISSLSGARVEGRATLCWDSLVAARGDEPRLVPAGDHVQGWISGPARDFLGGLHWQTAGLICREIVSLANETRVGSVSTSSEIEA